MDYFSVVAAGVLSACSDALQPFVNFDARQEAPLPPERLRNAPSALEKEQIAYFLEYALEDIFEKSMDTAVLEKIFRALTSSAPLREEIVFDYELSFARIPDLRNLRQVRKLFSYFIDDPQNFSRFVLSIMEPANDGSKKDDFRHPVVILSSGWGDCDDYAALIFYWAKLQKKDVYYLYIDIPDSDDNHIITIIEQNGKELIFDNGALIEDIPPTEYAKKQYKAQKTQVLGKE